MVYASNCYRSGRDWERWGGSRAVKQLRRFTYFEPTTLKEAVEILMATDGDTRTLAGGTDLVVGGNESDGADAPAD